MSKREYDFELDMRHKDRKFRCRTVKKVDKPLYRLVIPERQFFVQLISFAPGKGPKDYVEFHEKLNERRHSMDIHEIATFLTWGPYDMVVIWDAPNLETYNEFLAEWVNPSSGSPGTGPTLVGASSLAHK